MDVTLALIGIIGTVVGLFGWLLKQVMQENAKREEAYRQTISENQKVILEQQGVISKLADKYEGLKDAIEEIARKVGNAA